jgi:hypothetical protein
MHSAQRNHSRTGAMAQARSHAEDANTDALRARVALTEYHAACRRANIAPIGSPEFRDAMRLVQRLAAELEVVHVNPAQSWRERTRRTLRLPIPPPRPGQRARAARR